MSDKDKLHQEILDCFYPDEITVPLLARRFRFGYMIATQVLECMCEKGLLAKFKRPDPFGGTHTVYTPIKESVE
jgi:hypothetical protein